MMLKINKTTIIILGCLFIAATIASPRLSTNKDDKLSTQRNKLEDSIRNLLHSETKSNPNHSAELVFSSIKQKPVSYEHFNPQAAFPYVHPVMAPKKTSGFGNRVHPIRGYSSHHKGLDLAAPVGVNIRAMAEGRVIFADPYAGYGNLVVIDHGNQITTHYAHCDKLKIEPGSSVKAGQIIAEVGSTGASTGPHLHLEVRVKGQAVNPENFFQGLFSEAAG